jgi:AcrR family transcriptional regulator
VCTYSGVAYVAFVVDVCRIVGWKADTNMRTELVLDALEMAQWSRRRSGRRVGSGLIHHSDQGRQPRFKGSSQHHDQEVLRWDHAGIDDGQIVLCVRRCDRRVVLRWLGASTSSEAIAGAAGVATITVYATFQSKRALLARLVDAAVSGDRAPAPIYEQERAQAIMHEPDRRQFALFAAHMAEIMERVSPLFEVMDHAAAVEPEIAELRRAMLRGRLEGMRVFVRALEDQALLRPGLTEEEAAQTVWAVTAPQLFQLLKETWAGRVSVGRPGSPRPCPRRCCPSAPALHEDQVSRRPSRSEAIASRPRPEAHLTSRPDDAPRCV